MEMCQKKCFKWSRKRLEVANLIALDKYTLKDIASSVGVSRVSIHLWKKHPEFQEKITELSKQVNIEKDFNRIQHERKITEIIEKSLLERLDEIADPGKITVNALLKRYFEGMNYFSSILANMPVQKENKQNTIDVKKIFEYCKSAGNSEMGVSTSTSLQNNKTFSE